MKERNKPRQKEAKVLIIKIKKSLLKFNCSNFLKSINLELAPKIAPSETNKNSGTYTISLIFTHPLL